MKKLPQGKVPIMKIKSSQVDKFKNAVFNGLPVIVTEYQPKKKVKEEEEGEEGEGPKIEEKPSSTGNE